MRALRPRFKTRTPAGLLPAEVLVCPLCSSRAGYLTLKVIHFDVADACAEVLAILA